MYLLRNLFTLVFTFVCLALASLTVITLQVISLGRLQNWIIKYVGQSLGRLILAVAGVTLAITDARTSDTRPAVYIINHSSTLDLFIILALGLKNIRFVAKYELQYNPFFFILGHLTGQVFINRKDSEGSIKKLQDVYARIKKRGWSLFLAPEGSRKHEGVIGPFKKGAFHTALQLHYPIVPIYIHGASALSGGGSLFTKTGTVAVTLHDFFPVDTYAPDEVDRLRDDIRRMYLKWAGVAQGGWGDLIKLQ